jgi:uncharacterized protein
MVNMADPNQSHTSNRGFASMDEEQRREIASKGGQASGGNFRNDPERAAEAGRKGGHNVPADERSFSKDHELAAEAGRKGGHNVPADERSFSKDHELAAEAGRKGGEHSHGEQSENRSSSSHSGSSHSGSSQSGSSHSGSGHRGGPSNFAEDRERASEAGRKGGEHSHGGRR